MKNLRYLAALLLLVFFTASVVWSQPAGRGPGGGGEPPAFSDFDSDGDGYLTEDELNTGRARRMAERAKEGRRLLGARNAPAFSEIDADQDGRISEGEFQEQRREQYEERRGQGNRGPGRGPR